jgi:hypothetical protein
MIETIKKLIAFRIVHKCNITFNFYMLSNKFLMENNIIYNKRKNEFIEK